MSEDKRCDYCGEPGAEPENEYARYSAMICAQCAEGREP